MTEQSIPPNSTSLYAVIKPYLVGGIVINTSLFLLLHYMGVMPQGFAWLPWVLIALNFLMCAGCLLFLRGRQDMNQPPRSRSEDPSARPSRKRARPLESAVMSLIFVSVMAVAYTSAMWLIEQKKVEDAAEQSQTTR